MSRLFRRIGLLLLPIIMLFLPGFAPGPKDDVPAAKIVVAPPPTAPELPPAEAVAAIKPLPLEPIPHNPPPHEGAMFELLYRIGPPDLLIVEVLEALPGRPITGERLVRPDGSISLGFYGDVHVAGLTVKQAKTKIVHHLREILSDQALGLVIFQETPSVPPLPAPGTKIEGLSMPEAAGEIDEKIPESKSPFNLDINVKLKLPFELEIKIHEPNHAEQIRRTTERILKSKEETARLEKEIAAIEAQLKATGADHPKADQPQPDGKVTEKPGAPKGNPAPSPKATDLPESDAKAKGPGSKLGPSPAAPDDKADKANTPAPAADDRGHYVAVAPGDSNRVMVDVSAYNSGIYYVLGLVGSPGRLPITGRETVIDALQFAGGLLTPLNDKGNVQPIDVVLHRPARGDAPARKYLIDLGAIHRGELKANLQIFPGDRILVGRRVEAKSAEPTKKKK